MNRLIVLLFFLFIQIQAISQNSVLTAFPYCGGSLTIPAATNITNPNPPIGAYYSCLGSSTQNLTWFYIKFSSTGNFGFTVLPTSNLDVIVWGSFSDLNTAYNGGLIAAKVKDCYTGTLNFSISIESSDVNKYFIILVKNTTNTVSNITLSKTSGLAIVSCTPLTITSNSPLCEGDNLSLQANTIPNANYYWTGPNSFTSTNQNTSIPNYSTSGNFSFSCYYTLGSYTSPTSTIPVTVNPKPLTSNIYHY